MTSKQWITFICLVLFVTGSLSFYNCKGSETRDEVDESVETLVGKDKTDEMQHMKDKIDKFEKMNSERIEKAIEESDQ